MTQRCKYARRGVYQKVIEAVYPGRPLHEYKYVVVELRLACGHKRDWNAQIMPGGYWIASPPVGVWCRFCAAARSLFGHAKPVKRKLSETGNLTGSASKKPRRKPSRPRFANW